jgi:hypothetical protein
MTKLLRGIVHGRTIELEDDTGLEDGRKVEIILRAKELPGPPPGWTPGSKETAAPPSIVNAAFSAGETSGLPPSSLP